MQDMKMEKKKTTPAKSGLYHARIMNSHKSSYNLSLAIKGCCHAEADFTTVCYTPPQLP